MIFYDIKNASKSRSIIKKKERKNIHAKYILVYEKYPNLEIIEKIYINKPISIYTQNELEYTF